MHNVVWGCEEILPNVFLLVSVSLQNLRSTLFLRHNYILKCGLTFSTPQFNSFSKAHLHCLLKQNKFGIHTCLVGTDFFTRVEKPQLNFPAIIKL